MATYYTPARGSDRQTAIAGATTLAAGSLVVRNDTNAVVAVASAETATQLGTDLSNSSGFDTYDVAIQGQDPRTGLGIFETFDGG